MEPGKPVYKTLGGRWNTDFFQTEAARPLTLEVGCGKGDYTVGLALRFPLENFLGLDIKGERLWSGSTRAQELGLPNVGWLRGQAQDLGLPRVAVLQHIIGDSSRQCDHELA